MSVITLLRGPWALRPEMLSMMWDIYESHLSRGGRLSAEQVADIEASTGKKLEGRRLASTVQDGVAVIPIVGPMIPRATMFQEISGATSYQMIRSDIESALSDSSVRSILLNFDTPGGSVNQLYDLAAFIRSASSRKAIGAWTDGNMTSAGQLLGAAAGGTYIGSDSTELGSIGIVGLHRNISKAEEQRGEQTTVLSAGKYKAVGHPFGPLSEEHAGIMQERLDYLYTSFVNAMADYRGIDVKKVAAELADGRIFTGRQAIDAGLADGMMSFDDMLAMMREKKPRTASIQAPTASAPGGKATAEIQEGGKRMTRAELKEQHPALYAEVFDEGKQAGVTEGRAAAQTEERTRVMSILEIPGPAAVAHRPLLIEGVKTGLTAGDVALSIQRKEADLLADAGKGIKEGAVKPAPAAEPGADDKGEQAAAAAGDAMVKAAEAWQKRN